MARDVLANLSRLVDRPIVIDRETARRRRRIAGLHHEFGSGAGAAAPGFDFSTLPGYISEWKSTGTLWQLSTLFTPAVADADPVGAWVDTAGVHNLLQATAGKRPTLKLAQQNGLPVIRFDGVDDFLAATAFALAQPFWVFCVLKCVVAAGNRYIHSANTDIAGAYQGGGAGSYMLFASANGPSVALGTTAFNITCGIFNGASSQVRLNAGSAVVANPGVVGLDGFSLASKVGAVSQIDFAHIVLGSGALATADETVGRTQLNAIWACF